MKSRYIKTPYTPSIGAARSKNSDKDTTPLRTELVRYAMQFTGNPYRYGGTSLTQGVDCSGFTQAVFKEKGIDLPRTSRQQARDGRTIPLNKLQPGDLIFYGKDGVINHVALYIGEDKVLHASNKNSGIMVSEYNYRKPYKAVTYIDL